MAVRTIEIGSGAVDRRKWMYADSEMSFFGRENLHNSAFQRGKSFFIYSFKRNSSAPCDKNAARSIP